MQNQHKYRCDRYVQRHDLHDLNNLHDLQDRQDLIDLESRTSNHMADFITVHTFGGRGSPSF